MSHPQVQKRFINASYFPVTTMSEAGLGVIADRNPALGPDAWSGSDAAGYTCTVPANGGPNRRCGMDKTYPQADANGTITVTGNSFNHAAAGQNVACADASVRFQGSPNCGGKLWNWTDPVDGKTKTVGDNIWTAAPLSPGNPNDGSPVFTVGAPPAALWDSVLW